MTAGTTGIARYVTQLDKALVDSGVELRRFAVGRGRHPAPASTRRFRVPLRVLQRTWKLLPFPRAEQIAGPADVVHVTDALPPPTRLPLVLTVHDLDALDRAELHGPRARSLQAEQLAAARERADEVIAISAVTAAALQARGVDGDRISVVHLALTELPVSDPRLVPTEPYLLAVGTVDARKGLDVLIEAFGRARLDGVRLVIAGPDGHRADDTRAAMAAAGVTDRVVLPGRVTDAELAALYRGAMAYCLPSRAEGFGLPVLEAMAAGAPVIASDLPVVRELVGDGAIFVEVGHVDAWATALERLVADDAVRARLSSAGPSIASRYTWEATARATMKVYERAVAGQSGRRA